MKKKRRSLLSKISKHVSAVSRPQIPPYPLWFQRISVLGFILLPLLFVLGRVSDYLKSYLLSEVILLWVFMPMFGLLFLLWFPYSLYRVFRYDTKRALLFLGIAIIVGLGWMFYPSKGASKAFLYLSLYGVILGHGLLSIFWRPARRIGWFIVYYTMLFMVMAVSVSNYYRIKFRTTEFISCPNCGIDMTKQGKISDG